jgi:Holliday junction resolvase
MNTALICAPENAMHNRLQTELTNAGYLVDVVATRAEVYALLKYEKRNNLIIQSTREDFADLVRFSFRSNPSMSIYLFYIDQIFCLYPLESKPEKIVNAMSAAGIRLSPRLLGKPQPLEITEMALI